MKRTGIALAMFAALTACSGKAPAGNNSVDLADAATAKNPTGLPGPGPDKKTRQPDLAGLPLAPGKWFSKPDGILFGEDDHDPTFMIECDREAQLIYIAVEGRLSAPGWLHVATLDQMKSWDVPPTEDSPLPTVEAAVSTKDPFLSVLAAAKGRIGIKVGTGNWMVMPVDPGIAKTLVECHAAKPLPGEIPKGDD